MVPFDLWRESFIFALFLGIGIIVPCILIARLGMRLINNIGQNPSRTPYFQWSAIFNIVIIEFCTFAYLIGFYHILEK